MQTGREADAVERVDTAFVLDNLPDGVVLFDADIRLVYVNRRFTELTGWAPDEVVGRNGLELLDPAQLADALDALAIVAEAPEVLPPGAYRLLHRDGSFVELELHAMPVDPADPESLTAMMVRPVDHQTVVTDGIELLNAGGPIEDMAEYVVNRIGWAGGAVVAVFDDDITGERRSVHPNLPPELDGTRKPPDGTAPWDEVELTGEAVQRTLDQLPPSMRAAAEACGFVSCTADAVPDPGGRDAVIVLWFRADAPTTYRFLFREEPRYLLLRLALERRYYQRSLRVAATQDQLTGLANRARFFDSLDHRSPGACAVLYIDLDDFKPINDEHGHLVGDAVLAEVGRRLLANVRTNDVAARLGGDEFAVFCPDVTVADAEQLADRLLRAVTLPVELPELRVRVGASIGVAVSSTGATAVDALVDAADRLLYESKRAGKRDLRVARVP